MALFDNKVAVITGAARNLGRDYASFFAADGARVVVADIDEAGARKAAAELSVPDRPALGVGVDITDEASAASAVRTITDEFGGIDILINNAGLWGDLTMTSVLATEVAYWRTVIDVNLTGAFIMSRAVAPVMQHRGWGRIVHISSQGAWKPGGAYSVSKLALHSLSYGLAAELAPSGITVNCVAVGATFNEATQRHLSREVFDRGLQANLIKRDGTSADMYGAIRYLCSDEASYVTAQVLTPNGGQIPQF
jgi:3-oxoacyl-[acyl-carrier protein] reductase